MRAIRTARVATNCVALSLWATIAHGQSALPDFSNPYDGRTALVHADAARSSAQKSAEATLSAGRSPTKHMARKHASLKIARKQPLPATELATPATTSTLPVIPRHAAAPPTASKDSALDFGLQWSAANDPHYNTATSTIPALDELKRNANQTPPETGSAIEGGVNLRF